MCALAGPAAVSFGGVMVFKQPSKPELGLLEQVVTMASQSGPVFFNHHENLKGDAVALFNDNTGFPALLYSAVQGINNVPRQGLEKPQMPAITAGLSRYVQAQSGQELNLSA